MSRNASFSLWITPKKALITGASSGLGAAFAGRLAAFGFDCILLARRKDRLEELARELSAAYKVRSSIIQADLSDAAQTQEAAERAAAMGIDVLVNNAGYGTHGNFAEQPMEKVARMVDVHIVAAMQLAHAVLPGMRERKRGAIVNVASLGAFALTPGSVVYDSTKSFLVTFSENLSLEVERDGIVVQALCPGFTRTEFHDVGDVKGFDRKMIPDPLWMTADEVVRQSLHVLETGKKVVFIPGWKNRLSKWAVTHSPAVRAFVRRKAEERE